MGACLNISNNKTIIKVSESYKEKISSKKINNKTRATLTYLESETPKLNNDEISQLSQISIHSLCSCTLSKEIDLNDIKSNFSSIDNNSFIKEIIQIIHI